MLLEATLRVKSKDVDPVIGRLWRPPPRANQLPRFSLDSYLATSAAALPPRQQQGEEK